MKSSHLLVIALVAVVRPIVPVKVASEDTTTNNNAADDEVNKAM